MNSNGGSPTALVVDESASWRALASTGVREHGWTVVAGENLPEPAPAAPYELLVIEPASHGGQAVDLGRLEAWGQRFVLLTYLNPAEAPAPSGENPRLLGVLQKSTFNAT